MGGEGKGGGGWDPVGGNQQSGYSAFQPGQTAAGSTHPYFGGTVDPNHPDFQYYQQGWDKAQQDYDAQQSSTRGMQELFAGMMRPPEAYRPPEVDWSSRGDASFDTVKGLLGDLGEDGSSIYGFTGGKWQVLDKAGVPEDLQYGFSKTGEDYASGVGTREQLFKDYTDAAGSAADYVNSQITNERSNAALMGIKYDITDEQKAQRINDYFATLWTESQQADLQSAMDVWGDPKGFTGFTVTRGDASTQAQGNESVTTAVTTGTKPKRKSPLDDTLEESKSILGD